MQGAHRGESQDGNRDEQENGTDDQGAADPIQGANRAGERCKTDVAELGRIAAEAGTLVATHLSLGNPAADSDVTWRRLLRDSARTADFGGTMVLGADLLHLPVRRHGTRRH